MRRLLFASLALTGACIIHSHVGDEDGGCGCPDSGATDSGNQDGGCPTCSDAGSCGGVALCAVDSPLEENQPCTTANTFCQTSACCANACNVQCYQFICGTDGLWHSLEQHCTNDATCYCNGGCCGPGPCQADGPAFCSGSADAGWVSLPSGTTNALRSVWAVPGEAWSVGASGTILHWTGASWRPGVQSLAPYDLRGVWGADTSHVWAVGTQGVLLQWNGSAWGGAPGMPFTDVDFTGVFGTSTSDVWAVGACTTCFAPTPLSYHWDGGAWAEVVPSGLSGTTFQSVSGVISNQIFATTDSTEVAWWDGSQWGPAPVTPGPPETLAGGLWAQSDTWVTTVDGGVYNHIGGSWNGGGTGVSVSLRAIWRLFSGDVWAMGDQGAMVQLPAGTASWSVAPSLTSQTLRGVWGTSADELWAVGDDGTILHYGPSSSGPWGVRACGGSGLMCGPSQYCVSCPPGIPDAGSTAYACFDAGQTPMTYCTFPDTACLGVDNTGTDVDAGVIACING